MSDTELNVASTVDTTEEQQRLERDRGLAEQLVEQAKDQGHDLVGPDGCSPI